MMESPQLALLLSRRATLHESLSARPGAPGRRAAPAARAAAARPADPGALATALHHLGDAVAPRCTPSGAHPAHTRGPGADRRRARPGPAPRRPTLDPMTGNRVAPWGG